MTKITRFSDTKGMRTSNRRSVDNLLNRSSLVSLYPHAKTFDEQRADDERRRDMHERYLPKYRYITASLFSTLLFSSTLFFVQNIATIWKSGTAMVFFSFAIWLALLGLIILWIRYVNDSIFLFGRSTIRFWFGFCAIFLLAATLFANSQVLPFEVESPLLILSVIYFFGLLIYFLLFLKSKKPS